MVQLKSWKGFRMKQNIYSLLADALSYPGEKNKNSARILLNELTEMDKGFCDFLKPYVDYLENSPQGTLEEAYTSTFDVQAVCPLEIGYTLFGEDYKRGEFLVRMNDLHSEYKTPLNSSELADHLPNVLLLLGNMPENDFKKEFVEKLFLPALTKMLKSFDNTNGVNPFSLPLRTLNDLLSKQYQMNPKILEVRHE